MNERKIKNKIKFEKRRKMSQKTKESLIEIVLKRHL
jgi:hypothetical protein